MDRAARVVIPSDPLEEIKQRAACQKDRDGHRREGCCRPQPAGHHQEVDGYRDRYGEERPAALREQGELGESRGPGEERSPQESRHLAAAGHVGERPERERIERAGGVRISGRGGEASLHEEGRWISDGPSEIDESDREHDDRESAEEERDRFAPPGEPCEERVHQEVGERSIRPVPGDALVRGPGDRKTAPRREGSKEQNRNERRTRNLHSAIRKDCHDGEREHEKRTRV